MPTSPTPPQQGRRGRPTDAERDAHRAAVLDAAAAELADVGYTKLTMLGVARRASASKQTLYSWFGDKDGLIRALITRNAERLAASLDASAATPEAALATFGENLLAFLLSPVSLELNRAATTSPELGAALRSAGPDAVAAKAASVLGDLPGAAERDPREVFSVFYGLLVRDTHIHVLHGAPAPESAAVATRARQAVADLHTLLSPA